MDFSDSRTVYLYIEDKENEIIFEARTIPEKKTTQNIIILKKSNNFWTIKK